MRVWVLCLFGFSALIEAELTFSIDGSTHAVSMRTKRGRIKGTVKGAKFAQRFRAFTAKQALLRNAQLVKTRDSAIPDNYIYTKIGGANRAAADFLNTFPNNVYRMKGVDDTIWKVGDLGDHNIVFQYSVSDEEMQNIRLLHKQCEGKKMVRAISVYSNTDDLTLVVYYLEIGPESNPHTVMYCILGKNRNIENMWQSVKRLMTVAWNKYKYMYKNIRLKRARTSILTDCS